MVTVILIVIFGILFSYFATLNTSDVMVTFSAEQSVVLPLYIVILAAISLGVLSTYIIHLIKTASSTWSMDNKERTLSEARKEVAELTREVHQLELENTKLRAKLDEEVEDEDSI